MVTCCAVGGARSTATFHLDLSGRSYNGDMLRCGWCQKYSDLSPRSKGGGATMMTCCAVGGASNAARNDLSPR